MSTDHSLFFPKTLSLPKTLKYMQMVPLKFIMSINNFKIDMTIELRQFSKNIVFNFFCQKKKQKCYPNSCFHPIGKFSCFFCGRDHYTFLFELKYNMDLIFYNGLCFMSGREMHLDQWTLDFDLNVDVPSILFLVWVHLPHLPLHSWSDKYLRQWEKIDWINWFIIYNWFLIDNKIIVIHCNTLI